MPLETTIIGSHLFIHKVHLLDKPSSQQKLSEQNVIVAGSKDYGTRLASMLLGNDIGKLAWRLTKLSMTVGKSYYLTKLNLQLAVNLSGMNSANYCM